MAYDDARLIRRERVKALLLLGCSKIEIARELGCVQDTVTHDIQAIGQKAILEKASDATGVVFARYQQDTEWAIDQARKMQEALVGAGEEFSGDGSINALSFITKTRKEELEMAQRLGLLEQAAEKKHIEHVIEIDDAELIKKFGDFVATQD